MNENHNATIHFTGNDELDLELLDVEISTTYLDILASVLGLISAQKAKQIIIERAMQPQQDQQNQQGQQNQQNQQNRHSRRRQQQQQQQQQGQQNQQQQNQQQQSNVSHPTPTEIAELASFIGLYTIFIYTKVSFIRLNELNNNIQAGKSNFSITPNVNITTGFVYSLIGTLLRTLGVVQRQSEEAQITIL